MYAHVITILDFPLTYKDASLLC